MMATDLTKMVKDFEKQCPSEYLLTPVLEALAAEIEANREEIEKLKIETQKGVKELNIQNSN